MFLRKKKNESGSTSVQVISKERGKYKVVKTIGSSNNEQEIQKLVFLARPEIERLIVQPKLFIPESDTIVEQVFEALGNAGIRTMGPEIIFGKIYDDMTMLYFEASEENDLRKAGFAAMWVKQAFKKAELANFVLSDLDKYEIAWKFYRDLKGVIDTAFDEGKIERSIEIAKQAKLLGISVADIANITGLSKDEINKL